MRSASRRRCFRRRCYGERLSVASQSTVGLTACAARSSSVDRSFGDLRCVWATIARRSV